MRMIKLINITLKELQSYQADGTYVIFETDNGEQGGVVKSIEPHPKGHKVTLISGFVRYGLFLPC